LANCLQHKADDRFLTTVFRVGLKPYLCIVTIGMQRDTLVEHKQAVVTCQELDEKDGYCAIMEVHNVFKKKADAKKGEEIYNCYKKPGHNRECCHFNPKIPTIS
jgi:hypothetical protein